MILFYFQLICGDFIKVTLSQLNIILKVIKLRFTLMIEKARNNQISFLQSKYTVDRFHNPYLSKFTLKVATSTTDNQKRSKGYLVSPFDPTNHIYLSQSLPIYKSQRFRACLIWKQSVKKKMGRGLIGLSSQYKADNMWSIKTRAMIGSMLLYNLQVIKKFDNQTEAIFYHHGMYDNSMVAPMFGVGFRKRQLSATVHRRFGLDYNVVAQYTRPLPKGLFLCAKTQISIGQSFDPYSLTQNNTLSLDYYFQNTTKARAALTHELGYNQINAKIQVQKSTQTVGNFLFSVEYRNNASIFSFGYKNPTLNLVLPVFLVQSPIPTLIGVALYVGGYFLRMKNAYKIQIKKKEEELRINQLKLISDKGNANYEKQRASGQRGLLIQQAYVGPANYLDKLKQLQGPALLRDNQLKENVYDITVCLRFYVIKGQLRLKKGDKNHLLGFYCHNSDDQILIKYLKGAQQKQVRLKMSDQILIK